MPRLFYSTSFAGVPNRWPFFILAMLPVPGVETPLVLRHKVIPIMCTSYRSLVLRFLALSGFWIGVASMPGVLAQATHPALASKAGSTDPVKAEDRTVPALFISDIHFDPFQDPAKVQELVAAPATRWRSILLAPASSNQKEAFAALQQTCHARGVDTPFALLDSSLKAMRSKQPDAKFMTVSGDLIAHAFFCRFATLVPGSTPGDYQTFVLKTMNFVMGELRASIPGMPVYVALGNNDTECDDYQLDAGSEFLAQAGRIVAEALPQSQRQQVLKEFQEGGYYSITMPEPIQATRLIVVNDLFLSPQYRTCAGKPDSAAATKEMSWLEQQLRQARRLSQRVWIMGHIPPGIDPYSTAARFRDVCRGQAPVLFLSSDKMADLLVEYADVIRLGIFAHTHMDEMRLLRPEGSELQAAGEHHVVIKMVPSISPVDGNTPSFTVARVNPSSAVLQNYEVIAASNHTGIAATWTTEYDYAQAYHEGQFSPSTVEALIGEFKSDPGAKTDVSKAYIRNYFVGDLSSALSPFWLQYACALDNHTAKGYASCVCSTATH
jgi:sphingomyelin phosphodiesterase acid-like 3